MMVPFEEKKYFISIEIIYKDMYNKNTNNCGSVQNSTITKADFPSEPLYLYLKLLGN
jgi:hypothetical protein